MCALGELSIDGVDDFAALLDAVALQSQDAPPPCRGRCLSPGLWRIGRMCAEWHARVAEGAVNAPHCTAMMCDCFMSHWLATTSEGFSAAALSDVEVGGGLRAT